MTHPFAAHLLLGDLYAALFADLALMTDPLILSAKAFPVLGGTEDPFAEKPVTFRLQGAIVDGFRLLHLPERPGTDHFGGSQTDLY